MHLRPTLTLMLAAVLTSATGALAAPKEYFVYFGTYTKPPSKGIYLSHLDVATGALSPAMLAAETRDPSFVALHPTGKFLYAIDESADPAKTPGRGVSAYAIDPATGALTLLNQQSCGGSGPAHLTVDHAGKTVLVASYGAGTVCSIAIQPDGRLGAVGSVIQHTGSSVNQARQKGPHAHAIEVSPDNRFAFSPDLGLDKVQIYRLDPATAKLTPNDPAFAPLPPGSGPRHLAFHPTGKFAYVISEMLCTMSVFQYDAARGAFTDIQNISTLPPGVTAGPKGTSTAEVQVHPNGKFLYGSNRGDNTIVVYAIDAATGKLTYVETQSTLGRTPRHFALDPTGAWLLAENQDSSTVAVFRVDAKTGRLTAQGTPVQVPTPVSAVFVPVP